MQQAVQHRARVPPAGDAQDRSHDVHRNCQRQHGHDVLEGAVVVKECLVVVVVSELVVTPLPLLLHHSRLEPVTDDSGVDQETGRDEGEGHHLQLTDNRVDVGQRRLPAAAGEGGVVTVAEDMLRKYLHLHHVSGQAEHDLHSAGEPGGREEPGPGLHHDVIVL